MSRRVLVIVAGLAVVLVAAFTIFALATRQSTDGAEDNSLTVYLPFDEVAVYQKISEQFIANNPGVELTFEYIEAKDAKEYEAKVVNEIADGAGPDIWVVRSDWIPKHAAKSLPFEVTAEGDPITSAKTAIVPALVDLNTFQGKLFGVPLFADSLAMIYNLDLYQSVYDEASTEERAVIRKSAETWSIVKEQTRIATKRSGGVITRSGLALGTVETTYAPSDVLSAMLAQNGARILNEEGTKVVFNLAQFKGGESIFPSTAALDLFTSFARPSKNNYSWNNDLGTAVDAFKKGKTGGLVGYYSLLQDILEDDPGFEVGVAPLPQISTKNSRVDYGVTWSHIINSQTAAPSLAKSYLSYLAQAAVQQAYAELTGKITVRSLGEANLTDTTVTSASALRDVFRPQLQTVVQIDKKEWQTIDETLQDAIKLVVNSKQSPQTSVDSVIKKLEGLVE